MDAIENTKLWLRGNVDDLFKSISSKVEDVDIKMTAVQERMGIIEKKLGNIEEQGIEIMQKVDHQSHNIESIKNHYKKDMDFRNKLTLFVVVFLILIILIAIH